MPKFIRLASDLHVEFRSHPRLGTSEEVVKYLEQVLPIDEKDSESVLILAGDISCSKPQLALIQDWLLPRFYAVIHVAGNHEHYGQDISDWNPWAEAREQVSSKLHISRSGETQWVGLGAYSFIYCTLWTNCGENYRDELEIGRTNDFYQIRENGRIWRTDYAKAKHALEKESLREVLNARLMQPIVITHHLPSYLLCDPKFGNGPLDGLFASKSDDMLIGPNAPRLWMYGHTHTSNRCILDDTLMVCNPKGYPGERDVNYEPKLFIELETLFSEGGQILCL